MGTNSAQGHAPSTNTYAAIRVWHKERYRSGIATARQGNAAHPNPFQSPTGSENKHYACDLLCPHVQQQGNSSGLRHSLLLDQLEALEWKKTDTLLIPKLLFKTRKNIPCCGLQLNFLNAILNSSTILIQCSS